MASKYDWEFIRPLDQTAAIANMASGNQQINAGLQTMGNAVTGYADAMKQRNTDSILNALYQAQTSADLPQAMQAVQALQQQYGRGYDQTAVRNAIDSRGSTLGQRDLQAINLQQAQAAQAAIPQLNQANAAEAVRQGASPDVVNALAALGIDASSTINRLGSNALSDARDSRDYKDRRADIEYNRKYQIGRDAVNDANNQRDYNFRVDESNWNRSGDLSKENPKSEGYATDANGNLVTVSNGGISRMDAYGALSGVRGIRNNNPGNLSFAGQRGASRENGNGRFAAFSTPEEGLAAMSKQLDLHFTGKSVKAKEAGRPLQSVQDIIHAWAPPNENNTAKYIADVSKQLGVSPSARLNLNDPKTKTALMQAIVSKENGGNPYTPQQYAAGISGNARSASNAVGPVVSQAAMSKVTAGYQDALAKLEADFGASQAKDQIKGSVATTGKNIDTWVAGKKNSGLIFANNNTYFTKASDLANMARKDPAFNRLPENAQMNVLEGAYAKMNDVNAFQYVPDGDLKKFISRESQNYQKDRINQHTQAKNALFEQTYQNAVQAFQAAGSKPPTRESVRQLLDPQYKAPAPKQAPAQPKPQASQATKAVEAVTRQGVPALLSNAPNQRAQAVQQGRERATNVANMPTNVELQAMRAKALAQANTKREEEAARKAFAKLEEEKRKRKMSPQTRALINQFGGGILK